MLPGCYPRIIPLSKISMACRTIRSTELTDGLFMELPKTDDKQQNIECRQGHQNQRKRQMGELGHQRCPQSFAGIGERVEENNFLQDGELVQRAPGIVGTAKKYHRGQDHAEHQADVLLIYAATERKASAGREACHQQRDADEEKRMVKMQFQSG